MSALQKKCLVASAFTHGLLLVLVFVASAFIPAKPKDEFVPIELVDINATLVDVPNVATGGNPNAVPPPAAAQKKQTPQPLPAAPPPKAEPVKEPEPVKKKETPRPVEKSEPAPEPVHQKDPDSFKVSEKTKEKPPKPERSFDFSKAQHRTIKSTAPSKESSHAAEDARAAREAKLAQERAGAFNQVMNHLQSGLSKGIGEIGIPGPGGEAYASYGLVLRKIYEEAWIPPTASRGNEPIVEVEVVITREGHVFSWHLLKRSGRRDLDRSIENALNRVKKVPPFPSGSTDEKRTFQIKFNLTDKLSTG